MLLELDAGDAAVEKAVENQTDVRNRSLRIALPRQRPLARVAVDIGGSLAKVVYFKNGFLHFQSTESEKLDRLLAALRDIAAQLKPYGQLSLGATGGGAIKYGRQICEAVGVPADSSDEIASVIRGATFFISEVRNEVFSWAPERGADSMVFVKDANTEQYPFLLVNIGSGVSFIKVDSPCSYERIGGSALGGGTLWGLLAQLTPAKTFDEMLKMADEGNSANVDMLVKDIYGAGYPQMGLSATTTASFFAKAFKERGEHTFRAEDMSRSLLVAISYNIAQLAYLHAHHHCVPHIYFAGSYIRGHPQTITTLSSAIAYWSKGQKNAYFFRHEGYLGALGAFLGTG